MFHLLALTYVWINGYNELVGTVGLQNQGNSTLGVPAEELTNDKDRNAQQIAEYIWDNYCVYGVLVVSVDLTEHFRAYSYDNIVYAIGDYWKIIYWSKANHCDKEGANRPNQQQILLTSDAQQ